MGPDSSIILKNALTDVQLSIIDTAVESISNSRKNEDFWVNSTKPIGGKIESEGRPFIITHEALTIEHPIYDNGELQQIYELIGYRPVHSISFGAMCNDDLDHRILGELTLYLAKALDGYVDFGGAIFSLKYLPWYRSFNWYFFRANWSSIDPYFKKFIKNMPGNIYTIKYNAAVGKEWAYHICDVNFLEFWLSCQEFHMIK